MPYQSQQLSNGLTFAYLPQAKLHTVWLAAFVRSGSAYETLNNAGVSHLLEHLHLSSRSAEESRAEMLQRMNIMEGDWNARTCSESTQYFFCGTPDLALDAVQLMAEILTSRSFSERMIKEEKWLLKTELVETDQAGFLRSIFEPHSCIASNSQNWRGIRNLSIEDLEEFDQRFYRARNILVVLVGNLTNDAIQKSIERLTQFPADAEEPISVKDELRRQLPQVKRYSANGKLAKTSLGLCIDSKNDDRNFTRLALLKAMLSSHRVPGWLDQRYGKSNVYGAKTDTYNLCNWATIYHHASPRRSSRDSWIESCLRRWNELASEEFNEDWLENSRGYLRYRTISKLDDVWFLCESIYRQWLDNNLQNQFSIDEKLEYLSQIQPADVAKYAGELFKYENFFLFAGGRRRLFDRRRLKRLVRSYLAQS